MPRQHTGRSFDSVARAVYHARARPYASEYGTGMTKPRVHLRINPNWPSGNVSHTACGAQSLTWTRDPQAVTCPACISKMELQPA